MRPPDRPRLGFYRSPEHPCGYLSGRLARTLFLDPRIAPEGGLYALLAAHGFRRSGAHLYRPDCTGCRACVPVRVPVAEFRPDRSQRRVWRRNQDLTIRCLPAQFSEEHYALYRDYLRARHPGGGMDEATPLAYRSFLLGQWGETQFVEMRLAGALAAVAVMDVLPDALSAVYTFYNAALSSRSLGSYAILWEIHEARRRGLQWLYLGYWIAASRKMAYKARFRPLERLTSRGWQRCA